MTGQEEVSRCPVHSTPGASVLDAWACPCGCEHFTAEIDRRIDDIVVHGNFSRIARGEDGLMYRQQFANHEPVGEPVVWLRDTFKEER